MALDTRDRIYPAVNFVLAEIITPMRKGAFRRVRELITRLDFFFVSVAIRTEGLVMASTAGLT